MRFSSPRWGFESFGAGIVAVLLVLAVGALIGIGIGLFIAKVKMPPFIVTLAFMTIGRGFAYILSSGQPIRLDKAMPASDFIIKDRQQV